MNHKNPIRDLTKFELCLWGISATIVVLAYILSPVNDYLNLIASLIGVTALIFVSKGYVLGQILTVVFSIFYGIISFYFHYYGEMITYLGMTAPMALLSVFSWIQHPYRDSKEVEVSKISKKKMIYVFVLSILVTFLFYFVLKALNTANLFFSTISVTTSFAASYLTFLRSPYYALAYSANDIILIVLWSLASSVDIGYLPMCMCFLMFLFNDLYGFYNWKRIHKNQSNA